MGGVIPVSLMGHPGAHTTAEFFSGQALCVERPEHFFRADGPTPERVVLRLAWPEHLGPIEEARKKVRQRLDDLEGQARQQRKSEGRAVLGRAGVRRPDFRASAKFGLPRGAVAVLDGVLPSICRSSPPGSSWKPSRLRGSMGPCQPGVADWSRRATRGQEGAPRGGRLDRD